MSKEELESLLVSYGVPFTDSLADKLLEVIDKVRADAFDEVYNRLDEGVCDICDCKDFDYECWKNCQEETRVLKEWLKKKMKKGD